MKTSSSFIQTPNRFQALQDFPPLTYVMAAATPSYKLQHIPIPPPSSTQNASSTNTHYFLKPVIENLFLTSFTETPDFKALKNLVQRVFPTGCHWLPDYPLQTQTFYELILVDSKSVEITHTPDSKNPQRIAYSKCVIKKVLKASECYYYPPLYLYHSCDEEIEIMFKFFIPQAIKIQDSWLEYQERVSESEYS
ncbi:hypothetical protein M9H77_00193 [Catharanthus roseus]|nr:hypothetical protein M9H77_00193 [Catharanthus roseus]